MAIAFELVVNFGQEREAAQRAARSAAKQFTLSAGRHRIPLHPALLNETSEYLELSVLPVAVGFKVAMDGTLPRYPLTSAEFSELGQGLYSLLAKFDGYIAAIVGWDPEMVLDLKELETEYVAHLAAGDLHGLVLADTVHQALTVGGNHFKPFAPGYRWIPYQGVSPSAFTVDRP